ncbi:MAG: hypothetical protein RR162_03050 [Oscillospiraceae bacterium]
MRKKVVLNNGDIAVITPASVESAGELVGYMNLIGGESDNFTFGLNEFGVSVEYQTELISNMKPTSLTQIFIAKVEGEIVSQGEITFCNRARTMHTCSLAIRGLQINPGSIRSMTPFSCRFFKTVYVVFFFHPYSPPIRWAVSFALT